MTLSSGESLFFQSLDKCLSSKGLTLPGGVAGPTAISMTLQSALDLPPRNLTPPDGAPGPTGTSRTSSPPRDLTRRDGAGVQMDTCMTFLGSR